MFRCLYQVDECGGEGYVDRRNGSCTYGMYMHQTIHTCLYINTSSFELFTHVEGQSEGFTLLRDLLRVADCFERFGLG